MRNWNPASDPGAGAIPASPEISNQIPSLLARNERICDDGMDRAGIMFLAETSLRRLDPTGSSSNKGEGGMPEETIPPLPEANK